MKTINKGIITAAILGASAFAASAAQAANVAGDGTINIDGTVTASTCTINGTAQGAGQADINVHLPTVSANTFTAAGDTAGDTAFTMNLTGCTPDNGHVGAYFQMGANVDAANGDLKNVDTAGGSNVHVQLTNDDGTPITLGQSDFAAENSKEFDIQPGTPTGSNGTATLTYAARYRATAATTTPGSVHTSVVYSLYYN